MPTRSSNGELAPIDHVVIDFNLLTMAEQEEFFQLAEEAGVLTEKLTPLQAVRSNAILCWIWLRRQNPELTLEQSKKLVRGQPEVITPGPPASAGRAGAG